MDSVKHRQHCLFIAMTIAIMLVTASTMAFGQGATVTRSIQEFVTAQGTYCLGGPPPNCTLFQPPVPNFIGWTGRLPGEPTGPYNRFSLVDYAGVANRWLMTNRHFDLGTQTSGTVTERRLADGRAEVRVNLFTSRALAWVETCPTPTSCGSPGTPLFGYRAEVLGGAATAALADSFLQLVFINPSMGYPLPDFIQLAFAPDPNQELRFIGFRSSATGPLRSGFGVLEGTPGRSTITQTGLFMTAFRGATADAFPVEMIAVRVVGQ